MVNSGGLESSIEVNSPSVEDSVRVGKWLSEMGIEPDEAFVWPHEERISKSLVDEGDVDNIVGMTPRSGFSRQPEVTVAPVKTHDYTGTGFDFEYGWALGDDTTAALQTQIGEETNLHTFDYSDPEQRDEVLDNAFRRLASTSDRLLNDEDSALLYTMKGVNRYQMPDLAEDSLDNQHEYANRIASRLEEHGFETEIHYNPEASSHIYLSGQR